jgi:hypothetical protein
MICLRWHFYEKGWFVKKNGMLGEYDFSKGKRGLVISHKGKTRITILYWSGSGMKLNEKAVDIKQRSIRPCVILSNRINGPFKILSERQYERSSEISKMEVNDTFETETLVR